MANRNFMRIRYPRRNNQFAESFPVIVCQRRQRNGQKDETRGGRGKGKRFAHNGGLKMLAGRIEVFTRRIITFNENKRRPPPDSASVSSHTRPLSAINPRQTGKIRPGIDAVSIEETVLNEPIEGDVMCIRACCCEPCVR